MSTTPRTTTGIDPRDKTFRFDYEPPPSIAPAPHADFTQHAIPAGLLIGTVGGTAVALALGLDPVFGLLMTVVGVLNLAASIARR